MSELTVIFLPGEGAVVRMLGLVLIVPFFEELFWRSFVIRWIIDPDHFQDVPIGRVTLPRSRPRARRGPAARRRSLLGRATTRLPEASSWSPRYPLAARIGAARTARPIPIRRNFLAERRMGTPSAGPDRPGKSIPTPPWLDLSPPGKDEANASRNHRPPAASHVPRIVGPGSDPLPIFRKSPL